MKDYFRKVWKHFVFVTLLLIVGSHIIASPHNKIKKKLSSQRYAHYTSNHKRNKNLNAKINEANWFVNYKANKEWSYRRNIGRSKDLRNSYKGISGGYDD